jgi:Putative peptidoglycan binding domain
MEPTTELPAESANAGVEASADTVAVRATHAVGARRRLRQAGVVVGIALVAGAAGVWFGSRLRSPADAANDRAAPAASSITVPVEKRKLVSSLVIVGTTQFVEPTAVRLAGSVGSSAGDKQVVTRLPELGAEVVEGSVLMEVSGRPVFVMRGTLPMYRQLAPGATGPDVLQLETSLDTLGFAPGTVDEVYDEATEAAIDAFYQSHGFLSEGATESERKELAEARKAVIAAEDALRQANTDLAAGASTVSAADRLERQQAVERATAAVPEAQKTATRNNDQAAADTATNTSLRNNAKASRDASKALADAAAAPGAVNPDTGEAYSPAEIATLQQAVADKDQALIQAEQALGKSISEQQTVAEAGTAAVAQAEDALALARAQLAELDKPKDTKALKDGVTAAQQQVDEAKVTLASLEAKIGSVVPAGEVVFLPTLPTSLTQVDAQLGAVPPAEQIAQVSSTDTQIVGRLAKADANLVKTGTPVTIELRDVGIETTGVLTEVRRPKPNNDPNSGDGGGGGGDSSRLEVVVVPDDTSQIKDFLDFSARITVEVSATADEVLAVPVAALSVGPDGASRVEVERTPAVGKKPPVTEMVEVTVGLSAQGYAEITPVAGASLVEGDRVVVGAETGQRRRRRNSDTPTGDTATGDTATSDPATSDPATSDPATSDPSPTEATTATEESGG